MTDLEKLVVSAESPQRIMGAMDALMPQLPRDVGTILDLIKLRYWQLYGFDGLYERVNNRSVAQIFAEFDPDDAPKPIASGEIDGVTYQLYGSDDETDEGRADQ